MAGLVTTLGAGAMSNSIGEIRDAEFLFVIGSNTTEAHPIIAMEMKRAVKRGARMVVADPREIWLTKIACRHLPLHPGTDVWLLNALAHVIIDEELYDADYVEHFTEGFEAMKRNLAAYTPEEAEKITHVPAEDIRATAREYATTKKAGIYYTLGITEHSHGTDNVFALSNLALMTGHIGKESAGLNPLRGQNNVQGANDAGASPIFLPGYQRVDDPEVNQRYSESWGVEVPKEVGLNLNQMMKEVGKGLKGMYVMGEDLVISEPNVGQLELGLNDIEFLVVQDIFVNETTRYADVVLPASCFAEKDGIFTNSERRMQRVRKAVEPPALARTDWEIIRDVAVACGADWDYQNTSEIFDEMTRDTPKFAGISHQRIEDRGVGIQWPCENESDEGTVFLHQDGPARGRGRLMEVSYRPSAELPEPDYPLVMSTGRTLYHYNAATQTHRAHGAVAKQPKAFVMVHPRDARDRQIRDGETIAVTTRRGRIELMASITREVKPGCIWMPFHYPDARANLLTTDVGDPITATAEFKVCAAQIDKIEQL